MTLFFIRYTSIPQTHVFRIDCVMVNNHALSLRFSVKSLIFKYLYRGCSVENLL